MEEEKEKIVKERIENDPIYKLFTNGDDEFLKLCIEVIQKRYSFDNKDILRAFKLLLETDDKIIKIFSVIFFMTWEPLLYKINNNRYGNNGVFKKTGKDHFRMFMLKMDEYIEKTIKFPFCKYNIEDIVNNFVNSAKTEYLMGPF